jgi:hypothetical protein
LYAILAADCWAAINFSQGAAWNALISTYIHAIPLSGDAWCMPMQSMSFGLSPKTAIKIAMKA